MIARLLNYLKAKPLIGVSGGYQRLTQSQVDRLARNYDHAWQDDELPTRQYEVVKKQLELMRKTKQFGVPAKPAIDLVKAVPLGNPSILEIGCSSGYYSEIFRLAGLKVRYEGCDYSKAFIDFAKQKYPRIKFKVADTTDLPYKNGSFDVAFSAGCILHVRNYRKAISETARVAKNYLIFHRTPVCHLEPTSFFVKKGYGIEMMEIVFNESELHDLFAKNGFGVVANLSYEVSYLSIFPEPIYGKSYLLRRLH